MQFWRLSHALIAAILVAGTGRAQAIVSVPLKNWPAPLSWQPSTQQEVAIAKEKVHPRLGSENSLGGVLVSITPCRLVDTRSNMPVPFGSGTSSPLTWTAGSQTTVPATTLTGGPYYYGSGTSNPVTNSCNGLPAAIAYSANITVIPQPTLRWLSVCPTGTSTANCEAIAALTDYQGAVVLSNAAVIPATIAGSFDAFVKDATQVIIDINGYYAPVSDASGNTAVGMGALGNNTTGSGNTANGSGALGANTIGVLNTASGSGALFDNTTGNDNTASGSGALENNNIGSQNTASGTNALQFNTSGGLNTASGSGALQDNTTGVNNTAVGASALQSNTVGNNNIAIGEGAASSVSGGNSNNIHIGHQGSSADSGTIRIGTPGTHTSFFAAGVTSVQTGLSNAVAVLIDGNGQLGTINSSRRFKEDIQDMGNASDGLMRLRPVTFRYTKPFADGSKPIQYGLIAEEVEKVYPDLVVRSADGQVQTVKYQVLDSMLLNEVQRQQAEIREQREQIGTQAGQIRDLQEQIRELKAALTSLSQP